MPEAFHDISVSPSFYRILRRFRLFAARSRQVNIGHLVLAVVTEESLGSRCLHQMGVNLKAISEGCFGHEIAAIAQRLTEDEAAAAKRDDAAVLARPDNEHTEMAGNCDTSILSDIVWLTRIRERAMMIAKRNPAGSEASSEHLLQAMVEVDAPSTSILTNLGITTESVNRQLFGPDRGAPPLAVDFELAVDGPIELPVPSAADSETSGWQVSPKQQQRVQALLDANLNRAREGLRVLEDFARFVLQSGSATTGLKNVRHDLVNAERLLYAALPQMMQNRDVAADAGTDITTASESLRESLGDVLAANARRVQEALRSLEEFGKTVSAEFAERIKQLRYKSYSLEQLLRQGCHFEPEKRSARQERVLRMANASLYVLLTEARCQLPWQEVVEQSLDGGADVIQLREKVLSDTEIVRRGRWIAGACRSKGALFILNDRSDLAIAADADGVHIGQEDAAITTARSIVGDDRLIGVSTHNLEQLKQACSDNADYLGVGPVFTSQTKNFEGFAGLSFVSGACEFADRPWFPIGGISEQNVASVIGAGAERIAVCDAVVSDTHPQAVVRSLRLHCTPVEIDPETLKLHRG